MTSQICPPLPPFVHSVLVHVLFTFVDLCATARLNANPNCILHHSHIWEVLHVSKLELKVQSQSQNSHDSKVDSRVPDHVCVFVCVYERAVMPGLVRLQPSSWPGWWWWCLTSFSLSKGTVLLKTGVRWISRASRKATGTGVKRHYFTTTLKGMFFKYQRGPALYCIRYSSVQCLML